MRNNKNMYRYRKASPLERERLLKQRQARGLPLHAPPHYPDGIKWYMISAACFEHRNHLETTERRDLLKAEIIDELSLQVWAEIRAWVIMKNHYHILGKVDLAVYREWIRIKHSRLATKWNREDNRKGRQVWYRFQDRHIRGEKHYFATINYIHANPVRHECVGKDSQQWNWSSLHDYIKEHGRDKMTEIWKKYPVDNYGKGWGLVRRMILLFVVSGPKSRLKSL